MPKPSKKRQPPEHLDHVFQDEWVDDWTEVADHLAGLLKLPDLDTRTGLKKVHANLSSIQLLLDETFKHARHQGHTKIMAGVAELYIKMSKVDALLQDKLLVAGFYERLVTLADFEDTRAVALRALGTISLFKGKDQSSHFRKCAPSILRIALKHLDHRHTLHAVTGFFAHSSLSIKDMGTSFDLTAFGRALLDSFRVSTPTYWLFDHAMLCFNAPLYDMAQKCRHIPSFITLHTACLHSADYMRRVRSLGCLLQMDLEESEDLSESPSEPQKLPCCFTTSSLAENVKIEDLPPKLLQIMNKYGREATHISSIQTARVKYASLIQESKSSNADLCEIGRGLAHLIQNYQYSLPDVYCCHCGQVRVKDCTECFYTLEWPKLVENCIEELRKQSSPSDEDTLAADILQWKHDLYVEFSFDDWERFLETMTSKHPKHVLFRYRDAHRQSFPKGTLHELTTSALMEYSDIPQWLDYGLRAVLVEAGFDTAIGLSHKGDKRCYPLMLSSRTNAKFLLDNGPPDDPRRAYYAAIYILSHLVLEGSAVNFKKPTIKRALKEIELSTQFMRIMGGPIPSPGYGTRIRTAVLLRYLLPEALQEWGQLLQGLDVQYLEDIASGKYASCSIENPLPDDYKNPDSWPEKLEAEKDNGTSRDGWESEDAIPKDDSFLLLSKLSRCSWCGRPSAALRKCGGCSKERYCDTQCQKFHWEEHKAQCLSTRLIVEDIHIRKS
ncbi:hypothetical protein PHLGIDRAFT_399967 [Phlebiopsis gigantea 11061_1 CR5-6]|uniref:MYND-type domain-containing protein n=1 Tax=Phlebiopsis gigantea (strain 11061_1 CR5-6) TaxID=745531 RepID=A0A0C3S6U3_PHLG1|nr:hypothetical protein PHLGIDRAFT_399967 [Phlebiopsis gigantea 11061_1 CR5-6]